MSKQPRIAPDVKEQILDRIKNQGVSVTQAAKDHSVSTHTIYKWLGAKTEGGPSILEFAKLKKENEELLKLVGLMTLKSSSPKKRNDRHRKRFCSGTREGAWRFRSNPLLQGPPGAAVFMPC